MSRTSKEQEMVHLTTALEIKELPETGHDEQISDNSASQASNIWIKYLCIALLFILLPAGYIFFSSQMHAENRAENYDNNTQEENRPGYDIIGLDTNSTIQNNTVIASTIQNNTKNSPSPQRIKQLQIRNYKKGKALALTIHITHHAGTTLCATMRAVGPTPAFACMGKGKTGIWPKNTTTQYGWGYEETGENIEKLRPAFHFVSWEFSNFRGRGLHHTNWEHENLVSMIPMRHPLDRFLAGGKCGRYHKLIKADPQPGNKAQQQLYWEYANSDCADNYALRVLANRTNCHNGFDTSEDCLESAKNLLRRFTFILDQDCFDDSLVAMGRKLHLPINHTFLNKRARHKRPISKVSAKERINNNTLYELLQKRFRRDIELYEWSKTQSIVKC